jgi:hypothetical protein
MDAVVIAKNLGACSTQPKHWGKECALKNTSWAACPGLAFAFGSSAAAAGAATGKQPAKKAKASVATSEPEVSSP